MSAEFNAEKMLRLMQRQVNRQAIDTERIAIDDSTNFTLTPPADATSAILTVEDGGGADATLIARYLDHYEAANVISTSYGMPLGHMDTIEIFGADTIANFNIIGVDAAVTHNVQVIYYK
jgi:hypothetical protein